MANITGKPYYDDYESTGGAKSQNYHQILFRPAYAVQARELTQIQSIQQDQVRRFSDHVFKNGSIVSGAEFKVQKIPTIQIEDNFQSDGDPITNLDDFVGKTLVSPTNGLIAVIESVLEKTSTHGKTLQIRYLNSGNFGGVSGGQKTFISGETLEYGDSEDTIKIINSSSAVSNGTMFTVGNGIIYINGFFVSLPSSSIVVSRDSINPTVDIGIELEENFITEFDDLNLTDPAQGSQNFAAPGAHRLQLILSIKSYDPLVDEIPNSFLTLVQIINGEVVLNKQLPQYSEIRKEFARRTFDESGHYSVKPYRINIREHLNTGDNNGVYSVGEGGDASKLVATIDPGKSYVLGYEVENLASKRVELDKAFDFQLLENQTFSFSYGNYFIVDEVAGAWDLGSGTPVSLRSAPANSVTAASYSNTAIPGVEIGTANAKILKYDSGTRGDAACQYRLYIFNVKMTNGNLQDVQCLTLGTGASKSLADTVLESGKAVLKESSLNTAIYQLPRKSIRSIRDSQGNIETQYEYVKSYVSIFTGDTVSSASATVSTTGTDIFPMGVGALTQNEIDAYIVVSDDDGAQLSIASATVNAGGDSITIVVDNDGSSFTGSVQVLTQTVNAREKKKNLRESRFVKITCGSNPAITRFNLGLCDVFSIRHVYIMDEFIDYDPMVNEDVKDWFFLDNGQRETIYDHASLSLKPSVNFTQIDGKHLVVVLDFFEHDYTQGKGYFSVDSYPVDDTGVIASTIKTQEIPVFTSPKTGNKYDLRNVIDFRPAKVNTAANSTTFAGATEDPASSGTINSGGGVIHTPYPEESFSCDFTFYVGRTDLIVLTQEGNFIVKRGEPSENPRTPEFNPETMTVAVVKVSPYPSLSPDYGVSSNRSDLSVKFSINKNRRYTMKDIGVLDKRISNLEYYTTLTMLEKKTIDFTILDENGLNRFKNGFISDNFKDHTTGDIRHIDYQCAVDIKRGGLRPKFNLRDAPLEINTSQSQNVRV